MHRLLPLTSFALVATLAPAQSGPPRVLAWNDLGMHCIDPDFSVFSILPPYNTLNAQVLINGKVHSGNGLQVTWRSIADPSGSINRTSAGKTNFWTYVKALFGVNVAVDVGLAGARMPGLSNTPQPLHYVPRWQWLTAEGIPITPIDDARRKSPYPLAEVTVRNGAQQVLAKTTTTLPNSQEMECSRCHASGSSPFARPKSGWVFDRNELVDDRWNILRLHDEQHANDPRFAQALTKAGYLATGLFATAKAGTPILCARCHGSNALPGTGQTGVSDLTHAMHGKHAHVVDFDGRTLESNTKRSACYTCHPGFDTQCLRGAMGKAIDADGEFSMQCQSCHGSMSEVGTKQRTGWFDQPTCQNCHTGTATHNSGAIRFDSVFDRPGHRRVAASQVFATTPNVPRTGDSLYRFSNGHGGLQCSACHGPPHAIYPTSERNDNLQSIALQGHTGTVTDCSTCHDRLPEKTMNGPHGMHPIDAKWATDDHGDRGKNVASCRVCHGTNDRGTVLALAQGNRTYQTKYGTKSYWEGQNVSCYDCHKGPHDDDRNPNSAPRVADRSASTPNDVALQLTLTGTDANRDPLTLRIVSQPQHGRVGWRGGVATYRANPGYVGTDRFTYAANDGQTDSNLGTVTLTVTAARCTGEVQSYGFGCPGTGDHLPVLSATGCPTPGQSLRLSLRGAYGGGTAFLMIGGKASTTMLPDGCVLRVDPVLAITAGVALRGSGAGQGSFDLDVPVPVGANGTVYLQALGTDPALQRGWVVSNGLRLDVR